MLFAKKIIFSIPFVIAFIFYCLILRKFLDNPNLLFGIDMQTFFLFIWITISTLLTGFFFCIFVTLGQDRKIILSPLPAILLSSFLLLPDSSRLIVAFGSFFLFVLAYLSLQHTLNSYITFTPSTLLSPSISRMTTFLFLLGSFAFYLSFQQQIKKEGFSLPQPIFDAISKVIPQDQFLSLTDGQSISPENIEQIKNSPELLKQFGLTKDMLNLALPNGKAISPQQLIESQLKQQVENFVKPFQSFIPGFFAVLFFFSLRSLASLVGLLLGPLLHLVFLILDKTNFTTYTTEARPVRKLVV